MGNKKPVIIFDGVCVLCSRLLRVLLWADQETKYFQFATTQSDLGQKILLKYNYDRINYETVLLIKEDGTKFEKLECVIEVSKIMGGAWSLLLITLVLPKSWRNKLYDFVASRRYKWFGKSDYCALLPSKYNNRIIQ